MIKTEICRKVRGLNKPNQRTVIYSIVEEEDGEPRWGASVRCEETGTETVTRRVTADRERMLTVADLLATHGIQPDGVERMIYRYFNE